MAGQPAYQPAMVQVRSFVARADRVLGPKPAQPLDAASAASLLEMLDTLNAPLHDLSLGASHLPPTAITTCTSPVSAFTRQTSQRRSFATVARTEVPSPLHEGVRPPTK